MGQKKEIRIPTVLAVFILIVGLFSGLLLLESPLSFLSRATSPLTTPQDVRITNKTDTSFAVSWITVEETTGLVRYKDSSSPVSRLAVDTRDNQNPSKHKVHYVEITNLSKDTPVKLEIISGGKVFTQPPVSLGAFLVQTPQVLPIYGEIENSLDGVIVYFNLEGAAPYSTFIKQKNSWVIPLASVRSTDLNSYYCQLNPCDETLKFTLEMYSDNANSQIMTNLASTRPFLESIVIGQNYNTTLPPVSEILPTTAPEVKGATTAQFQILNPKEGEGLIFDKPLIRGLGVPGKQVFLTLQSKIQESAKIKVDPEGRWSFTPTTTLEPGKNTLTVKSDNGQGELLTLVRQFNVFKSGQQVLGEATPSATLTPTITIQPTAVPTLVPPVNIPTPTLTPSLTPSPTLPTSGSFVPSLFLISSGVSLLLLGLTVF